MSILILSASSMAQSNVFGDSTSNFGILASTYSNTSLGTSIVGDLGYTSGPQVVPSISGSTHVADSVYSQAGIVQNAAISSANSQVCTTNLGTTVDLSLVQGGMYTPGVYCTTGAASIGTGGITLSGDGIYIFKIGGALTTVANSAVRLNGVQASNVSWVPTQATTLGANTQFAGIILDSSGVTMSSNVMMTGRVLAFGGTVSTNADTITVPSSAMADAVSGNFQCTVTFPTGAIDLGSNVQYPDKTYPPGVYCIDGAANIGSGPITLSGSGVHIFKINGALNQAVNTDVILSNGALSSGVIWVPAGPTTIGANSHLIGTVNGAPITIGANSDINGIGPAKTMAYAVSGNFQCTVTFPTGAIDLGSNVQYPDKVYPPGVYCIDGIANIGSGPITLTGNGNHIFKINGALNQAANTDVILSNGALSSGVIWIPTGPITIGANSNLIGTVNGAPITIGANSDINGVGPKIMADAVSGNFGILASTYTNTSPGTSIAGDLGYTTGPLVIATVDGVIHKADSVYSQAGIAQNTATSFANSQVCTTNLGTTVNLSLVHGGVYTPGVYCITGAASIGASGITLSGDGIYIFKINGALTTVANSIVTLNGAQASNISWVPTGATTLGVNTQFAGIILDASGVTMSNNVDLIGRVLAFGGTVSTSADTITVPSYAMADITSGNVPCTVTFPTGAIDLGSNVQYPDKTYPPGVYCIDGIANIGSGPITLSGSGAHIFKINGALNQAANTDVILSNGALASGVVWMPTGPTTIGANSHLIGTVNGAPITIGANSDINGIGPAKTMADAVSGSFGVLASTYSNTSPGTSIVGDLGYTTGALVVPSISGSTHIADSVYSQAGIMQNAAISSAKSQVCTTNLGTTVDLSLVQGGMYTPGVYCTTGAASIGAGGITLSGDGIYIFKIGGALTTVANSAVRLNGVQASNVSWVPTGATTLGADTTFAGIILDSSGVTMSNNVMLTGQVLAFGGTVSTNADTITVPSYAMSDAMSPPLYATGDTTVPEFGTIAAMILAIAVASIIAVSARTRLGIMPKYN